ncbi:MAG TPA: DoxX family protein [Steroidobacteraceae bacterium]|jgi:putative oxidoreductase|nr:DoxX family protein [Steroidobacteraceae bacterium]
MHTYEKAADLSGRILISAMFLNAGLGKISGYAGTQGYMEAVGVPGALLPLVIALEVLGAAAIIVGYRTRIVAASLAAFTVMAAVLFHSGADQMQQLLFMKNLAVAGGFLFLVARGAGDWSLDARRERLTSTGEPLAAVT